MLYDIDKRRKREDFNDGFWDNFTGRDVFEDFQLGRRRPKTPPVNIIENDNEFVLELMSPGMCKKDFDLIVENDVLNIVGQKEADNTDQLNYTRREFQTMSFNKSFLLPEYVNSDEISASCQDGVLTIHIPKKEEARIEQRNIKIS